TILGCQEPVIGIRLVPTQYENIRWVFECESQERIAIYHPSCRPGCGHPWWSQEVWLVWLGLLLNNMWRDWNCSRNPRKTFGKWCGRCANPSAQGYCKL